MVWKEISLLFEYPKNRCRYPKIHLHPKQNERAIDQTKALMSKRKPEQSFCYAPTEESGCIFYMRFFSRILSREWRRRRIARIIHIPGRICHFALGFCKNKKKRTETLYQSFSPFMVPMAGLEPAWTSRRILSPLCLPIPPHRHMAIIQSRA